MNYDDLVKRLREQADEWFEMCDDIHEPLTEAADAIERLQAELVEAVLAEREACAKVAEDEQMLAFDGLDLTGFYGENTRCRSIAAAIRARTDDAGR